MSLSIRLVFRGEPDNTPDNTKTLTSLILNKRSLSQNGLLSNCRVRQCVRTHPVPRLNHYPLLRLNSASASKRLNKIRDGVVDAERRVVRLDLDMIVCEFSEWGGVYSEWLFVFVFKPWEEH